MENVSSPTPASSSSMQSSSSSTPAGVPAQVCKSSVVANLATRKMKDLYLVDGKEGSHMISDDNG